MHAKTLSLAERAAAAMMNADRAAAMLGMHLLSVDAGTAAVEMPIRADMLNGHGTCHGGILFALADTALGLACNSRNRRTVSAAAQIDYLRPALPGDILQATVIERSTGRRLGLYDVTVTNQHGQTVALFRGKSCRIEGTLVDAADDAANADTA